MKSKKFVLGTLLLAATLGMTACGSSSKDVVLWNPFTGNDGDFFQKMVDDYNKTNPEVKIKSVITPDMYTKINTVMNSKKDKDVPDLTIIHAEKVELFQSQGLLQDMDSIIAAQPNLKEENFVESAWKSGEVGGKRYTVPLDVHSVPLYYNEDLLNKYLPTALDDGVITWDEIDEITPKAKADGIVTYPIAEESRTLLALVSELGGEVEKDGVPTLETPEFEKALTQYQHIVESGAAQEDGDDVGQMFQTGGSVFLQSGTWDVGVLSGIEDLNWGMTNTPTWDVDNICNWTSSHQFGMLKKERSEEKVKAIGEFLEYVRENSDVWADSGQNVASKVVFESEDYKKRPQAFLTSSEKELDSMKIFDFKANGTMFDALNLQVRDVCYGRTEVKEGLKAAQKEVDDKLKAGDQK